MSSWQKAGISFNKYLAIAARTVQRSLKNDLKVAAEKRYTSDAKVQKLEKGNVVSTTELGSNKSLCRSSALGNRNAGSTNSISTSASMAPFAGLHNLSALLQCVSGSVSENGSAPRSPEGEKAKDPTRTHLWCGRRRTN
ncbi:hypothetical protein KL909_001983 [Ogataea angusta]|nr:hypothetical protein KL909_001983 [Ogataea angusta]